MLKGLVTKLQGKQQLCIHLLHESLVGQCKYKTQPKSSFWCHVVDKKSGVLFLISEVILEIKGSFHYRYKRALF